MTKDRINQIHDTLIVVDRVKSDHRGNSRWLCQCMKCGRRREFLGYRLEKGNVRCRCVWLSERMIKREWHGQSGTRLYQTWSRIKKQKGKTPIDPRWDKFSEFYKDMGNPPSDDHRVVKLDRLKPYCKENMVWQPSKFISQL